MRAAVLTEVNKPLQILDLEQEGPKAGEVRVQVKAAGVCMSDWHIMNGDWPLPLPMVLGHEAAGIVAELGPGVTNVKKGDHVIFSFRPHCGHCRYCSQRPHRAVLGPQRHAALAHARRHRAREAQRRAGQPDGAHRHVLRVRGVPGRAGGLRAQGSAVDARRHHRLQRGDRRRRRHPPRQGARPARTRAGGRLRRRRPQRGAGRQARRRQHHHRLRPARQQARATPASSAPPTPSMPRPRTW